MRDCVKKNNKICCSEIQKIIGNTGFSKSPIRTLVPVKSSDSFGISPSKYRNKEELLRNQLGDLVNSLIELYIKRNVEEVEFYFNLWNNIMTSGLFPKEEEKIFALYYVIIEVVSSIMRKIDLALAEIHYRGQFAAPWFSSSGRGAKGQGRRYAACP